MLLPSLASAFLIPSQQFSMFRVEAGSYCVSVVLDQYIKREIFSLLPAFQHGCTVMYVCVFVLRVLLVLLLPSEKISVSSCTGPVLAYMYSRGKLLKLGRPPALQPHWKPSVSPVFIMVSFAMYSCFTVMLPGHKCEAKLCFKSHFIIYNISETYITNIPYKSVCSVNLDNTLKLATTVRPL